MDTNKVLIGDVYQVTKRKENSFEIDYTYNKIKENALLFRQADNTYLDVEEKLVYEANLNANRQLGDAFVFSGSLLTFNSFLDKKDRCSDMPDDKVKKIYQKVKPELKK